MTTLVPRLVLACSVAAGLAAEAQTCAVRSGAQVPRLIELYTSEGCSSCPPADRWLSGFKPGGAVIAAAFHVDYWNQLGWPDRFSDPAFTERQRQGLGVNGARYAYTPQVVVDGRDWRGARLPITAAQTATVQLTLRRHSAQEVSLTAETLGGSPAHISLWWARLEDGHSSRVRAGENRGETLRHDHVVRDYGRWPVWDSRTGSQSLTLKAQAPEAGHASRWIAVATDARGGKILQAVELGC